MEIWNLKLWIFRACKVQKDKQEFQVNVAHWGFLSKRNVFINFRKLLHNITNTLIETKQVLYFLDQELPLKALNKKAQIFIWNKFILFSKIFDQFLANFVPDFKQKKGVSCVF